ncbi:MAG: hypothetical protein RLO52_47040 [Sandaracinaceae bacterium]
MRPFRGWLLRLAAAGFIAVGLTGPAPGDVGGCGVSVSIADPVLHCEEKSFWQCRREEFSMRATPEESAACYDAIPGMCPGASWPADCEPTPAQSQACIDLLQSGEYVDIPTPELLSSFNTCNLCP